MFDDETKPHSGEVDISQVRTENKRQYGVEVAKVDDNRLYHGLDKLSPLKEKLEVFLKERLGELFELDGDLLLYDVTSTYFEGSADKVTLAKHGYSRNHRSDCKQVCIGLVVPLYHWRSHGVATPVRATTARQGLD